MLRFWYCDKCQEEICSENVTYSELHDRCGCPVRWVEIEEESDYDVDNHKEDRKFRLYNINQNGITFVDVNADLDYIEQGEMIICMKDITDELIVCQGKEYSYSELEKWIIE